MLRNGKTHRATQIVTLICLLLVLRQITAFAATSTTCSRVSLKQALPQWISSAAYIESQNRIGVVDPLRNKLLIVSPLGQSILFDEKDFGVSEKELTPAILSATNNGFLLSMIDQRLWRLDQNLNRIGLEDLDKTSKSGGVIVTTYDFVVVGGDILSVGAVKTKEGYRFGFFRAPLNEPNQFTMLKDVPSVNYYTIGNRYMAGLKGKEYGVLMTPHPSILEFSTTGVSRVLNVIPDTYQALPFKTQPTGPSSDELLYKEVEGRHMPAGLYAQNGLLYLLTRDPGEGGRTEWRLWSIDPSQPKPHASAPIKLPTNANHLTVVNTAKNWFIFERGAVQSAGNQVIGSMLVIPNSLISTNAVPSTCPPQRQK